MSPTSKNEYIILCDFDGTLADTFTPSPNNIGVDKAYRMAILDIFGDEGEKVYESIGGLRNRASAELISDMLKNKPELFEKAKEFAFKKGMILDAVEPEKKLSEFLVQVKLEKISNEIGKKFSDGKVWPSPFEGVIDFFKKIDEINIQNEVSIKIGIISSGHTEFQKKVFSLWGITPPQVLVTDDDVRPKKYPLELSRRIKPSPFLVAFAHHKWLHQQGVTPMNFDLETAMKLRDRMVYIGDDPVKDGNLAHQSKIPFLLFNHVKNTDFNKKNKFSFENWGELVEILKKEEIIGQMREGEPFSKIIASSFKEISNELKENTNQISELQEIKLK